MKAEILTIGDEVLRGEIVDSNKALLAQRLLSLDIECHYQSSIRDDRGDMEEAFSRAVERSDVLLVSGGLGPTRDDITTEVMSETFRRPLFLDEASLESIRAFFRNVGRDMSDTNRKQAFFPEGASVLANPVGTAPGFALEQSGCLIFCMPGVPRELSLMMDEQVLPRLEDLAGGTRVRARILRTFGIGESSLESELSDLARKGGAEIAFRTTFPDNLLRIIARGRSTAEVDGQIDELVEVVRERLGDLIYAEEDESMASTVVRLFGEKSARIAAAESCTGGLIAQSLTSVPGASGCFLGGVVSYANSAKEALLGVPESMLAEFGAVSEPVARTMAEQVRLRFGADVGVATTGISGPDGGTEEKPVGLVHLAMSWGPGPGSAPAGLHSDHFVFPLDRQRHRVLTAQVALDWMRRWALGLELVGPSLLRKRGGASAPPLRGASTAPGANP